MKTFVLISLLFVISLSEPRDFNSSVHISGKLLLDSIPSHTATDSFLNTYNDTIVKVPFPDSLAFSDSCRASYKSDTSGIADTARASFVADTALNTPDSVRASGTADTSLLNPSGIGVSGYFSLWNGIRNLTYGNLQQDGSGNIIAAFAGERSVTIRSSNDNAHLYLSADSGNTATTISQDPRMFFQSANATRACIYYDEDAGCLKLASNYNTSEVSINMGTGYVGIGTNTPSQALDIISGVYYRQIVIADNETNTTIKRGAISGHHYTIAEEPIGLIGYYADASQTVVSIGGGLGVTGNLNSATEIQFHTAANTTTTNTTASMMINSAGNVGIGTASPDDDLDIESAEPTIRLTDSDGGYARIYNNSGNIYLHADPGNTQSTSGIYISVDGLPPMAKFDENQRLGIGTNAPDEKLHVDGNIKSSGTIYGDSIYAPKIGTDASAACSLKNGASTIATGTAYWHLNGNTFTIDIPELSGTVTSGNTTTIVFATGTLPNPPGVITPNWPVWVNVTGDDDYLKCLTYGGTSNFKLYEDPSGNDMGNNTIKLYAVSVSWVTN